jgi:diguanylate cyclase (GGDEF)-like protein
MNAIVLPPTSIQPDTRVRSILVHLQTGFLIIVVVFGGVTLADWVIPCFGALLPETFHRMRANTALLIFLCGLSVTLSLPRSSKQSLLASRLLAGFVTGFATLILLKDFGLIRLHLETLLAADATAMYPGKVSPEAAITFILLGIVMLAPRARKSILSRLIDSTTLLLCLAMLVFLARYLFGLSHLFVNYEENPFSVQTLFCLLLLICLVASRRAEYGFLAIFLDRGSGGMTARYAAPLAVLLPFLVVVPKEVLVRLYPDNEIALTAVSTAILGIIAVCLVLLLSWRTKAFEATIHELSLRDELTGLYNRRGFYVLAEQALQLAHRSHESFSVLFFDMDNLKLVNDELGHDAGSALLQEMAELLVQTFRKTDVIGRIGGDEFVVAGESNDPEMTEVVRRLEETVARANRIPARLYQLSFSMGAIASGNEQAVSLEGLLAKADASMYEDKRRRKLAPTALAFVATL